MSAIDYLIRTHGQDALVGLIRSYADGVSDDDAFAAALGVDVAGFEAGWLADLGIEEPPAYGPRPAPPGPLPPGWDAGVQAPTPRAGLVRRRRSRRHGRPIGRGRDLAEPVLSSASCVVVVVLVVLGIVRRGSRPEPRRLAVRAVRPAPPTEEPGDETSRTTMPDEPDAPTR